MVINQLSKKISSKLKKNDLSKNDFDSGIENN